MIQDLTVEFQSRDFSRTLLAPDLIFVVDRFSKEANGGPLSAKIEVVGDEIALWQLFNFIRCPVIINNELGTPVWWGFINDIDIVLEHVSIGISLREMGNRLAVAYNELIAGEVGIGTRGTTGFAVATDSINEFGIKERMESLADADSSTAINMRNQFLQRVKYPIATIKPKESGRRRIGATLECRSWRDTLGWQFWLQAAGREAHESWDDKQQWGAVTPNNQIKQTFQIAAAIGWAASSAAVRAAKEENVGGQLNDPTIELWSDSGGLPDAQLATGVIDRSTIPELPAFEWVTADWTTNPILAPATTYHFILNAQGTYADDEYAVQVDEALGYASGSFTMKNNGSWVARSPDADLAFRISGVEETTSQMETLVNSKGEFITSFRIHFEADGTEQVSGKFTSQYRDGDFTALDELLDLLEIGRGSGRRYLVKIFPDRSMEVFEEPAEGTKNYRMRADGQIETDKGAQIDKTELEAGFWLELADIIPESVDLGIMTRPDPVFIEKLEYIARTGELIYDPRDVRSPWDLFEFTRAR